jgi:RimJ/RimL family protein N-acetyltransferase
MRINSNTKINGDKVLLVPYRDYHVEKYHEWMSSEEIRELTSSEQLTLDEEYEMQKTWLNDEDKLTFIIIKRDDYSKYASESTQKAEQLAMIGDVNAFIYEEDEEDEDDKVSPEKPKQITKIELEIMIVDKENRHNGYGTESISLIISYCLKYLKIQNFSYFFVKIDDTNEASIRMFENKFGFIKAKHSDAFKQTELRLYNNNNEKFINLNLSLDTNYNISQ